ncbi:DNA polymerase III subunit gamma and tau [Streptomyces sp. RKND-216]|uniref:DNA polymerase III subunit gamma and tau n=1 Tax=Streptomyces sp. RKND-216 TaxID=2562581 RepID=UPI00109D9D85|nr:DNA polymerase III subunit gamma and tau [Streptomyces sp. RKND-216]THA25290.1 DNA polymerase III subunit gamma and tau [Streptomyces sp. RKND-216]
MSSLALYRRYRPETFTEVIGQEHVTDPLQQALRNNRVNHAYLFSGPRGCGKTTSARILARCLNCEQGPTPTPCGGCRSCLDLARNGPGSIDVIEIDAASHGGVDDARELREKAFFGPASSRYKIYIIDEAHMVTPAGFNALLKVVEEPPEHLKFIFATTEPEKVIGTIRSRTHHYPFRLVPPGTLRDYLSAVCEREAIPVDEAVLPLAVRAGAGSVRDSMSVMDQLLAGAGEDGVTYAMATALLGYTDGALLDEVVEAFAGGDGASAFEIVDRVIEGGHDPRRFVADLLERLRDLVILAAVPDAAEKGLIDAPVDVVERMVDQARKFGAAELSRAADLVNSGLTEMRGATSPRLQLELICARVLLPATYADEQSVQARLDRLERGATVAGAGGPVAGLAPAAAGGAPGAPAVAGPAAARAALGGPAAGPPQAEAPSGQAPQPHAPQGPVHQGGASGQPAQAAEADEGEVGPDGWPVGAAPAAGPQQGRRSGASPAGGTAPQEAGGPGARGPGAGTPARRPGAWPTGTGPAEGAQEPRQPQQPKQQAERRPGEWPGAGGGAGSTAPSAEAAPEQGQAAGPPAAQPQQSQPPGAGQQPQQSQQPQAPSQDSAQGAAQVRQLWPQILEAVKNRRRFTWILLSQNAQVVGFDGTTLQVGFSTSGARDSFANGGSVEVLVQALNDAVGVQWKVEAVVDPSGGAGSGPASGGGRGPGPGQGGHGGPGGAGGSGWGGGGTSPGPGAGAVPHPSPPPGAGDGAGPGGGGGASAASPSVGARQALAYAQTAPAGAEAGAAPRPSAPVAAPAAPPSSIEDDMPADDDADLDESALSGYDLIVRELGATVIEEIPHD